MRYIFIIAIIGSIMGMCDFALCEVDKSPFIAKTAMEDISKRTEFSKTFCNEDGSFTNEYSVYPLHVKGVDGKWNDIDLSEKSEKIAVEDSFTVDYPFKNAWYNSSTNEYDWSSTMLNKIGYDDGTGRNRRQMFRWNIEAFGRDIYLNSLMYTFHHVLASGNLNIVTCRMSSDPDGITDAEDFYTHICFMTPTNYTAVLSNEGGAGKVYDVDLWNHITGFEWRINENENTYFAVGHKIQYEGISTWSDICASQGSDGKYGGRLYLTYTYRGGGKVVPYSNHIAASPNPFNPSTTVSFSLPATATARLVVYDITGRKVRTLVSVRITAGNHSTVWDGRDDAGRPVSSGVYIARLESGSSARSMKMLLVR